MKNIWLWYTIIFIVGVLPSQSFLNRFDHKNFFPLAQWSLFSDIPSLDKKKNFLYFINMKNKTACYFYLCPKIDKMKLTSYHFFNLVYSKKNNFYQHIDKNTLNNLGYKILIKSENITMVNKWLELAEQISKEK